MKKQLTVTECYQTMHFSKVHSASVAMPKIQKNKDKTRFTAPLLNTNQSTKSNASNPTAATTGRNYWSKLNNQSERVLLVNRLLRPIRAREPVFPLTSLAPSCVSLLPCSVVRRSWEQTSDVERRLSLHENNGSYLGNVFHPGVVTPQGEH